MQTDNASNDTSAAETPVQRVAIDVLVANLRNAHALEKQVLAVLQPQLRLLRDYPDLHGKVSQHITDTQAQVKRLEKALKSCGTTPSLAKDALLSFMGIGQASVQGLSSDAVLKAVVADMMTEHLEIATYRMLIVLAELAGKNDLGPALKQSLLEEQEMADWFNDNLEHLTRRFIAQEVAKDEKAPASSDASDRQGQV